MLIRSYGSPIAMHSVIQPYKEHPVIFRLLAPGFAHQATYRLLLYPLTGGGYTCSLRGKTLLRHVTTTPNSSAHLSRKK